MVFKVSFSFHFVYLLFTEFLYVIKIHMLTP